MGSEDVKVTAMNLSIKPLLHVVLNKIKCACRLNSNKNHWPDVANFLESISCAPFSHNASGRMHKRKRKEKENFDHGACASACVNLVFTVK